MSIELSPAFRPECASIDYHAIALESALVWRNCALSPQTSSAGRRACRSLMRAQAMEWRRLISAPPPELVVHRLRSRSLSKQQTSLWPSGTN